MSTFDKAIETILQHELAPGNDPLRGWVDHPADPGAETNWGISTLMIVRENMSMADLGLDPSTPKPYWDSAAKRYVYQPGYLKKMPLAKAIEIYKRMYWDPFHFDQINDQTAATKIADCGVNCGQNRAIAMAQRAATACGHPCNDDGVMGPKTIAAINAIEPKTFVRAMGAEMQKYYNGIVAAKPAKGVFLKTWTRRAQWGVV